MVNGGVGRSRGKVRRGLVRVKQEQEPMGRSRMREVVSGDVSGKLERELGEGNTSEEEVSKDEKRGRIFGIDPSPEVALILLCYFSQGALGISRLAASFFFKDSLGLSPAEMAAFTGLGTLPWMIKPFYGFLSDSLPLFGFRRKSYLVLSGLLGAASWLVLGTAVDTTAQAVTAFLLASMGVAISDVVADSLVVERVRGHPQSEAGKFQSLCWGASAVGGLLSSYFSGSLLETMSPTSVFKLTSVIPLLGAAVALTLTEKKQDQFTVSNAMDSFKLQGQRLWGALKQKAVWMPTLFVFLWQATPNADSAMFYFNTTELQFPPEFLGRVRLLSSAAALLGVGVFQTFLKNVPVKKMLVGATLISVPLGLTPIILVTHMNRSLGIPDQTFALGDTAVLGVLGQVAFMPTLVLAARLCPPGVEGTLFAALMSIYNASGAVSTELGALMTSFLGVRDENFSNLPLLLAICNMLPLAVLPLAGMIDAAPSSQPDEEEQKKRHTDKGE
ncbi:hypothetical protein NDN08_001962 [Rhodosorus marinus]|uniref:Folate/biopterin transporter n=1 Tax=Rhodosorus marinus TaxID=101924 RepID=A0AAV8USB6_9RHOD|nr:hypothetical protein NDN08_001962 [Rhodosorus marinus]